MMKWKVLTAITIILSFLFGFFPGAALAGSGKAAAQGRQDTWAALAPAALLEEGIINAEQMTGSEPGKQITRLEFAVLMAKAFGVQPCFPSQPLFLDIPAGSLESGYAEALAALGIIRGTGRGVFGKDKPITRQDAAVMLYFALHGDGETAAAHLPFKDAGTVSAYAVKGVAFAAGRGLMKGKAGKFYPRQPLSWGEAVSLAERVLTLRREQASQVVPPLPGRWTLGMGESRAIKSGNPAGPLAFTAVLATDNPEICSLSPDGSLILGSSPGKGTITISEGRSSVPLELEVTREEVDFFTPRDPGQELAFTYSIAAKVPDTTFARIEKKDYPGPAEGLASKSDAWTGFLRQEGREILVDLGALKAVTGVSMEFKQAVTSGIYWPRYVDGQVSPDGRAWYRLGRFYPGSGAGEAKSGTLTAALMIPPVNARYLKISFPVDVYVFIRHLQVVGTDAAAEPAVLAPAGRDGGNEQGYLIEEDIKDILLVFTGDQTELKALKERDFLVLTAYLDPRGRINGRMFDTIQFMPYTGMPCTAAAWSAYLDDLFKPGQQLDALNRAMMTISQWTGRTEKEKVILTIPYPDPKQADFGSLTPGEPSLSWAGDSDAAQTEKRAKAVRWYYDRLMLNWRNMGFSNLELAGVYWYKEGVDPAVKSDPELIRSIAGLVREDGHRFFWIPFFGASGLENWRDYGFTHVFLQPNYYFLQDQAEDRMDQAAALARKYHTGIELELDNRVLTNHYYYDLFYKELDRAHELGLDRGTPNVYYVGFARTILDAACSEVPELRQIYDDLYRWIKGTYTGKE